MYSVSSLNIQHDNVHNPLSRQVTHTFTMKWTPHGTTVSTNTHENNEWSEVADWLSIIFFFKCPKTSTAWNTFKVNTSDSVTQISNIIFISNTTSINLRVESNTATPTIVNKGNHCNITTSDLPAVFRVVWQLLEGCWSETDENDPVRSRRLQKPIKIWHTC